ncbi:mitochondrial inner membrane protease subunit 2 isoform X2 [Sparus aurata]|uniref:mitochondrial inner membrane protease subunit 2 isoform X2 n=1 Tax=Sparus aurata TaxID=8175 RepID=UPI0011C11968|nr:mitochondrial inner membrane protease subunit 2 isoform X2 [Sparus aurata]
MTHLFSVMAQQATAGRRYLRAFVSGFFVAVPVTVTVLDRFAYVARVEGASMQPSLNPDGGSDCDVVLLNRWSVRNYQVQRGDIVSVMSGLRRSLLLRFLEDLHSFSGAEQKYTKTCGRPIRAVRLL